MATTQFKNIDEYINTFPPHVRARLHEMRTCIQRAAPEAKEAISYQMPSFTLHGNLIHFAAWKNHIGFYGASGAIQRFTKELSPHLKAKGTLQFPLDQPLPLPLISEIVEFRAMENKERNRKK